MFKGILIDKVDDKYTVQLQDIDDAVLPEGDVDIDVMYSTLNYKDGLAITGKSPVVRRFPMIPGIDLVGTVTKSTANNFSAGDTVLLNGFGVGETHCGGLAQKARLKSEWLISLPSGMTPEHAMAIGTAGYTAMLCVIALEKNGVTPESGEILVTGANGGVGSFAITILSKLGYKVVASTGRMNETDYLTKLGASEVIDRNTLSEPGKPMVRERWAGAVDSVGSHTLANVCASTKYGGTVAACGLAQGMDFPASVAPFILRGITLNGIDSVMRPIADRVEAWERLANILTPEDFADISTFIGLGKVIETAEQLLEGKVRGRVVVDVNKS
ncbi:MDR family oxidoreductase [Brumicola nitratireducens]|uniref:Putative dehydrogenase, NAD(P)-binding domain and GroES-like domain protein n=1 Tax=Glaciecola nitratireducens (strain JCM 12485 / KCTC 12276 / FR1064) TaxID=1085623 RepID=G4QE69_GLANF|nr:MDR family oxidoreductase [Glaciecola nitratireducens]AEP31343.1 putative dehydrogenase, NAD(P)-binding domain and GroES-like domain protein [Glaciecola nitratireducens FR1064]